MHGKQKKKAVPRLCKAAYKKKRSAPAKIGHSVPADLRGARKALRLSEEKFRKTFSTSPDAININRLSDGAYLEVNDSFTRITGYTRKEVMGRPSLPHGLAIWANLRERDRLVASLRRTGEAIGFEASFRCKDGRVIHGIISAREMTINGEVCILSVTRDITGERQAAEALKESERRFRELANALPLTVYEADLKGRFTFVNNTAKEWFGYTDAEIEAGINVLQVISPEDRAAAADSFKKVIGGLASGVPNEYRALRKDGTVFPVLIVSRPILAGGTPAGLRGIVLDISRRKVEEEALRKSEAHYRVIFESIADAVVVHDFKGLIRDVNERACAMFGYRKEELIGSNLSLINGPEENAQLSGRFEHLLRDGVVFFEGNPFRKDGVRIDTQVSSKVVTREGAGIVLGLVRDVTEHRRMERALHNAQKLESLGVLAGGIAHDFNNLLGGIFGYAELARGLTKEPKVAGHLQAMLEAMDRARALTQQLLTFAKGGAPVLRSESLIPFLTDAVNFAMSGSNVAWELTVEPGLWNCRCDRNQVGQVINNLLINAQQAMPAGGELKVSAVNVLLGKSEHPSLPADRYIRITVADRGPGIPPEIITRIFEPFFTTKDKGSGLGLATSYSIVRRHEGWIDVESEPGKGAAFHIYLPACDPGPAPPPSSPRVPEPAEGRILLMDDETVIRKTTAEILARLGYDCTDVSNGREAMAAFQGAIREGRPFRAIILDLTIAGGMGGIEIAAEMRKNDPLVPLIVFSGYADDPAMARPAEFGFTDSLQKPFQKHEIAEVLERNLRKKTC